MSDDDANVRTWPVQEHPVIHLRRPGDTVTLVFEPEPPAAQYPADLLTPARLRLTGTVDVYDAPDGTVIRAVAPGTVIDVSAIERGWWRVTQPPVRPMWIRAPRLVY